MNAPVFFASAGDERGTPQEFFDKLNAEFHFDLDAAASALNHKCELYFGEGGIAFDALAEDWAGMTVFLNPPYSVAGAFIAKAREEADKGATVVLLLPVRADTKYWHSYVWDKDARRVRPERQHTNCETPYPDDYWSDGDWRPGVRCRFIPGRLNFELHVPAELRTWIVAELSAGTEVKSLVDVTGLPRMAIERIGEGEADDCLLDGAPFPSCVVIFTSQGIVEGSIVEPHKEVPNGTDTGSTAGRVRAAKRKSAVR